jgi:peptidoglycan/xylan/chitin deacetylase (PgdA/CDA1 family)
MKVFMFHSAGLESSDWVTNYLSIPVPHFEEWFRYLSKSNYKTCFLNEWYDNESQDEDKLVITFDDGYLDNWVYLFPLLEKYQIRATVFVNPEFVDTGCGLRNNLFDVWDHKMKISELQPRGFLNWEEMKKMEASGLVDIQSHSMSHDWYFTSNNLIDIYSRDKYNKYYWVNWFLDKQTKPFYMVENQSGVIPAGYPIFTHGRSLGVRKYFPNNSLIELLTKNINLNDEFKKKSQLSDLNRLLLDERYMGRMETDKEMVDRYKYELKESKEIIERNLNKKVDYLCWPGGGYNEISIELSKEIGYKASTIASFERNKYIFNNSDKNKRIPRYSLGVNINYRNKNIIDSNPLALRNNFIESQGSRFRKYVRYSKKIYYILFK